MWWGPTGKIARKAAIVRPLKARTGYPHRGRRAGHACTGVPQEPGRSLHTPASDSGWVHRRPRTRPQDGDGCTGLRSETKHPAQVPRRKRERAAWEGAGDVGGLHSTEEAGEAALRDPVEGRGSQTYRPCGGQDAGNTESHHRLNETPPDSDTGSGSATAGTHDAGASHRCSLPPRGVSTHTERWRPRDRRTDGGSLCGGPCAASALPPRPLQVRHLCGSSSPPG